MALLGECYSKGNGVQQDYSEAARYYLAAEAQNHLTPASARRLARLYQMGITALPDLADARKRMAQLEKIRQPNSNFMALLKAIKE